MLSSSTQAAHKLGANRKEPARKSHRRRTASESNDIHEDRGTMKSKFSRPESTTSRVSGPQRTSYGPQCSTTAGPSIWPAGERLLPEHTAGAEFHVVHLRVFKDGARNVCVAGTFNDWKPNQAPLQRNGNGEWEIALSLKPGDYEYRFLADDQWMDDPLACRHAENPFGGVNAVLHVHGG